MTRIMASAWPRARTISATSCATNRLDEATRTWEDGIKVLEVLTCDYPNRPVYTQELARLLHNLGVVQGRQMKVLPAEKTLRRCVALREQLVREHPEEPAHVLELASGHSELAVVLAGANKHLPSAESFRQAIAVLHGKEKWANEPDFLKAEITYQTNLGMLLKFLGQEDAAKKSQERINAIRKKLAEGCPCKAMRQSTRAWSQAAACS